MSKKSNQTSLFNSALMNLLRFTVGFSASYVIGSFIIGFLRISPAPQILIGLSFLAGVGLVSLGTIRISMFWYWFSLVFGLICLIPLYPFQTAVNVLGIQLPVPFVVLYFTTKPLIWKVFFLFLHTIIALSVTANLHIGWPFWKRQFYEISHKWLENAK